MKLLVILVSGMRCTSEVSVWSEMYTNGWGMGLIQCAQVFSLTQPLLYKNIIKNK